jgi:hypothetical protein
VRSPHLGLEQLRALAAAALADSDPTWTYVDGPLVGDVHVETRPSNPGRSRIRLDPNAIGPFIAAASPGTILALLDEIDRLHRECDSRSLWQDRQTEWEAVARHRTEQLAAMTAARDTACEIAAPHAELNGDDKDVRRIAELRKVGA